MHSHDKTLLAKLGFNDVDKKEPKHDLACMFLDDKETNKKISEWMKNKLLESGTVWPIAIECSTKLEHHLQKGFGQYATTIGFIDVLISFEMNYDISRTERYNKDTGYMESVPPYVERNQRTNWKVFGEVKICKIGVGDIIRQMNLYQTYLADSYISDGHPRGCPIGILFAPWELSVQEIYSLEKSKYSFIQLGKKFDEWQKSIRYRMADPTVTDF